MQVGWITHLAVYFVIWWITIFMVLPWGNEPIGPEDVTKGQSAGAPKNPRLLFKAAINSVLAGLLWGVFFVIIHLDLITFRPQ
jgi:predicted secreted protein